MDSISSVMSMFDGLDKIGGTLITSMPQVWFDQSRVRNQMRLG
jgi:hypothetical protein